MAQELEKKISVSAAELQRCHALLEQTQGIAGKRYVQVNYYFDTPAFALAEAHTMLRVRRKKDSLYLQYKNKRSRTGDLLLCDEAETPLSDLPHSVNPSEFFPGAPDVNCTLLGELVTYRNDFTFPGAVVSLDENYYLGKVDFEVEIEGERTAIETIAALLNPQANGKTKGKFSRFLNVYRDYFQVSTGGNAHER